MTEPSRGPLRNQPLRMTLSGHEKRYIDDGYVLALRSLKRLSAILLVCIVTLVTALVLYESRDYETNPIQSEERLVDGRVTYVDKHDSATTQLYLYVVATLLSAVVGFVVALKLIFAIIEVLRFRAFRDDHEMFLKQFRR